MSTETLIQELRKAATDFSHASLWRLMERAAAALEAAYESAQRQEEAILALVTELTSDIQRHLAPYDEGQQDACVKIAEQLEAILYGGAVPPETQEQEP